MDSGNKAVILHVSGPPTWPLFDVGISILLIPRQVANGSVWNQTNEDSGAARLHQRLGRTVAVELSEVIALIDEG
jgi:hypothetical protein